MLSGIYRTNTAPQRGASYQAEKHADVMTWNHFPRYWSFVRGIHRSPVNSPHKRQWRGASMFSLNDWVNNREAGDLRCHRAHYDVIVMAYWRHDMETFSVLLALMWRESIHRPTVDFSHNVPSMRSFNVCLSHWSRDKIADISQAGYSNVFSWMKTYEFRLIFYWSLSLRVQLTISQHRFR